ncbi:hypothetical protein SASPL_150822 [Salvia splendens]|uniref:Wall-associated receptor kinase galacturonan-binding domain-containing protein n=1 Tax=Salvia splendens TaxID=180675 RepID=A0A8X8Z308_SALSN|nr:hypothetical protein SASPL_150822 [Salvia splendens]
MMTTQKLFLTTLILSLLHSTNANCSLSGCGDIGNITFPFHLKSHCGYPQHELICENNSTFIYLNSIKYHVKAINYQNSTIRLVDASINNDTTCPFPNTSSDFTRSSSPYYYSNLSEDLYVKVGSIEALEVPHMCTLGQTVLTSWRELVHEKIASLSEIHQALLYGFELNFCYSNCSEKPTKLEQLRRLLSNSAAAGSISSICVHCHYHWNDHLGTKDNNLSFGSMLFDLQVPEKALVLF